MSLTKVSFSMIQGSSLNVLDYGAPTNGTSDCYAAFQAAIDALPVSGGTIVIPATDSNQWTVSQTLNVRKKVHIIGQIAQGTGEKGTTLIFPANTSGIVFNSASTSLYTTVAVDPLLPGAFGSILENVALLGDKAGSSTLADGVVVRCGIECRGVAVRNFFRYGFRIDASIGAGGSTEGDANGWVLYRCQSVLNGDHGVYVDGNDANVGVAIKVFCQLNSGYGIYENSLIGNTYIGCDTVGNTTGSIYANRVSAANTFIGAWEDGASLPLMAQSTVSIGGNIGADTDAFTITSGTAQSAPFIYLNNRGTVKTMGQLGCRSNDTSMTVLGWGSQDENVNYNIVPQFKLNYSPTTGSWDLNYNVALTLISFPNSFASPRKYAPLFPGGIFFGSSFPSITTTQTSIFRLDYSSTQPATGTWDVGDRVFNSAPSVGQPKGWIRTVSGTEGTLNSGATTGTINIGTPTLIVNSATGITRGNWLSVAGAIVKSEVLTVNGTTITLANNATASVAGVAVAYVSGTWVSEGNL
jgi:hypothetical protein